MNQRRRGHGCQWLSLGHCWVLIAGAIFTGLWIALALCILNGECSAGLNSLIGGSCAIIVQAYPSGGVFLVGSSLERRDFRDMDVRCMLPDHEFEALFPNAPDGPRTGTPAGRYCR